MFTFLLKKPAVQVLWGFSSPPPPPPPDSAMPSGEGQPTCALHLAPQREQNQLTVDLEGSVSLVGPPFLCCKRDQVDYDPSSPEGPPCTPTGINTMQGSIFISWL